MSTSGSDGGGVAALVDRLTPHGAHDRRRLPPGRAPGRGPASRDDSEQAPTASRPASGPGPSTLSTAGRSPRSPSASPSGGRASRSRSSTRVRPPRSKARLRLALQQPPRLREAEALEPVEVTPRPDVLEALARSVDEASPARPDTGTPLLDVDDLAAVADRHGPRCSGRRRHRPVAPAERERR